MSFETIIDTLRIQLLAHNKVMAEVTAEIERMQDWAHVLETNLAYNQKRLEALQSSYAEIVNTAVNEVPR